MGNCTASKSDWYLDDSSGSLNDSFSLPTIENDQALTLDEQNFLTGLSYKLNKSFRFSHLDQSVRDLIALDLCVKTRFLQNYFVVDVFSKLHIKVVIFQTNTMVGRDKYNKHGLYQSALVIGDLFLWWGEDSLCVPQKYDPTNTILSSTIITLHDQDSCTETLCAIISKIYEWNICRTAKMTEDNCQHFVDELCSELDWSRVGHESHLYEFASRLRLNGKCFPVFNINEELSKKLQIRRGRLEFYTKNELQEFTNLLCARHGLLDAVDLDLIKRFEKLFFDIVEEDLLYNGKKVVLIKSFY
ncbi:IDH1 [Acrasis kona]|uniref:IDH1 n=1 Tax=Acrasis kona TaxID=1008807 RepID=A0AAW2ZSX9_9EUKA